MSFLFGSCRVKAFRDFPSHFTPLWKCHLSIIINSPSSREDSQSYFKNGFNSTKKATSTIHENSLEEEIRDEDPFQWGLRCCWLLRCSNEAESGGNQTYEEIGFMDYDNTIFIFYITKIFRIGRHWWNDSQRFGWCIGWTTVIGTQLPLPAWIEKLHQLHHLYQRH